MCKKSKEQHKGHSWKPDSKYDTIFQRQHPTDRHTYKKTHTIIQKTKTKTIQDYEQGHSMHSFITKRLENASGSK
jgi:hypothetical protein